MESKPIHRLKIEEIYSALDTLKDKDFRFSDEPYIEYQFFRSGLPKPGWQAELVYSPKEVWKGKKISFPIMAYYTKNKGPALWIISGIHGEEPAGPNAIAENIEIIRKLGEKEIPVVLLPLCNPHGYFKNYRYPHQKKWEENGENRSVGDSEFYLPDLKHPSKPRSYGRSCPESRALISKVLELAKKYPPVVSVDFHEDSLLDKGYIYCSGQNRNLMERVSKYVLNTLRKNRVKIQAFGETRFREPITHGVVLDSIDGSIDELLSARNIVVNNKVIHGPYSSASIVLETPAQSLSLSARIKAHSAVIRSLKKISEFAGLF